MVTTELAGSGAPCWCPAAERELKVKRVLSGRAIRSILTLVLSLAMTLVLAPAVSAASQPATTSRVPVGPHYVVRHVVNATPPSLSRIPILGHRLKSHDDYYSAFFGTTSDGFATASEIGLSEAPVDSSCPAVNICYGVFNEPWGDVIYKTTDDGVSWQALSIQPIGTNFPGNYVDDLACGTSTDCVIYADTGATGDDVWELASTTDSGASWKVDFTVTWNYATDTGQMLVSSGPTCSGTNCIALVEDWSNNQTVGYTYYSSDDGGASWTNGPLPVDTSWSGPVVIPPSDSIGVPETVTVTACTGNIPVNGTCPGPTETDVDSGYVSARYNIYPGSSACSSTGCEIVGEEQYSFILYAEYTGTASHQATEGDSIGEVWKFSGGKVSTEPVGNSGTLSSVTCTFSGSCLTFGSDGSANRVQLTYQFCSEGEESILIPGRYGQMPTDDCSQRYSPQYSTPVTFGPTYSIMGPDPDTYLPASIQTGKSNFAGVGCSSTTCEVEEDGNGFSAIMATDDGGASWTPVAFLGSEGTPSSSGTDQIPFGLATTISCAPNTLDCGVGLASTPRYVISPGCTNPSEFVADRCTSGPVGVNAVTGESSFTRDLLSVPGRGMPLDFGVTYNSHAVSTYGTGGYGPLGYGWASSYTMNLVHSLQRVTITQENGSTVSFEADGQGNWVPEGGVMAILAENSNGTWTFTRFNQSIFTFSATGQLTSESDLNGNTTTLSYSSGGNLASVTDPSGRQMVFSEDSSGLITKVTDPAGRSVSITYDANGNLASITDAGGGLGTFAYDSAHQLTSFSDPLDHTTTVKYSSSSPTLGNPSQVTSLTDPMGRTTSFSITVGVTSGMMTDLSEGTDVITDPRGVEESIGFGAFQVCSWSQVSPVVEAEMAGCPQLITSDENAYGTPLQTTTSIRYDQNTLVPAGVRDPNGNGSFESVDSSGNVLHTADPMARQTASTYNSLNEPTSYTDGMGKVASTTYDSHGNPLTITDANGHTTSNTYDSAGDLLTHTDANGNTTTNSYDTHGDLTSSTNALGKTATFAYNEIGEKTSETNPDGGMTTYQYDPLGRITSTTDPDGSTTTSTYDADGNVISTTDALGQTTSYTYDADNEETSKTLADGSTTTMAYDADGNETSFTNGNGETTTYSYDDLNRVSSTTNALGQTTSYTYDKNGNVISSTASDGTTTAYTYDADNEVAKVVYPNKLTPPASFTYDADGRVVTATDASGATSYTWKNMPSESDSPRISP